MKIKEILENLVIIDSPSWKVLLFAPILLILGLSQLQDGWEVDSLVCSRTIQASPTCEISRNILFVKKSIKQFPLNQLKEARVEKPQNSKMIFCTLVTEAEVIKFGSISTDKVLQKQEIASKINSFLQNPNQVSLSVKESPDFFMIFFGTLLSLIGLLLLYSWFYFIYSFIDAFIKSLCFLHKKFFKQKK